MVTVPVGAAIVTACLLAWAVLGDGLSTRVRIRSLTDVDQASGQTVSWSRHSYYAGMVPSGGFTFPLDALVYPIEHIPKPGERRTVDRQLVWTPNEPGVYVAEIFLWDDLQSPNPLSSVEIQYFTVTG